MRCCSATPALCQSRTCASVTDVTTSVEAEHRGEGFAFIQNEIYKGNTIRPGCLEGAFSKSELDAALRPVLR